MPSLENGDPYHMIISMPDGMEVFVREFYVDTNTVVLSDNTHHCKQFNDSTILLRLEIALEKGNKVTAYTPKDFIHKSITFGLEFFVEELHSL